VARQRQSSWAQDKKCLQVRSVECCLLGVLCCALRRLASCCCHVACKATYMLVCCICTITWGTPNLSLQHISGEAAPVKLGPGQEVPAGTSCGLLLACSVCLCCTAYVWMVGAVM
jgi:hypothetical protein